LLLFPSHDQTAQRAFTQLCQDTPHKNDYILFRLADMTDHDGTITPCHPTKIMSGFDVQIQQQELFDNSQEDLANEV